MPQNTEIYLCSDISRAHTYKPAHGPLEKPSQHDQDAHEEHNIKGAEDGGEEGDEAQLADEREAPVVFQTRKVRGLGSRALGGSGASSFVPWLLLLLRMGFSHSIFGARLVLRVPPLSFTLPLAFILPSEAESALETTGESLRTTP
jgi:hypothetical protein